MVGILLSFAYNCEEDLPSGSTNYVTFEASPSSFDVEKDGTTTKDIYVYAGNTTGSSRTFNVSVDPSSTISVDYTVPSSVTIPANSNVGALPVSITDDNSLEYDPQTLVLNIEEVSGTNFGDTLVVNVRELCPGAMVVFSLELDTWPNETTWEIYDLSGTPTVLYSGGPYANPADDFALFAFEWCFLPGEYGVVVYDAYGDGGPTFSVKSGPTTYVPETTLGGSSSSFTFTID